MADLWQEISTLLSSPISSQSYFLSSLISHIFSSSSLPEKYEPLLTKSMLYLTSWILLPKLSSLPHELPSAFTDLYSQLNEDTSSLYSSFISNYISSYHARSILSPNLFAILYNEITLSILLAIPSIEVFQVLTSEHAIPPLLWLLTYTPSLRNKISTLLTQAVMKEDGVYFLIKSISKGDDKDTLRRFIISILSSMPKTVDQKLYARNIMEQMMMMICKEEMDIYFENIIGESINAVGNRAGDTVRDIVEKFSIVRDGESVNGAVKGMSRCVKREPPSCLVMYCLDRQWEMISELNWFLRKYRSLELWKVVREMIVQQMRYSEISAALLYSALNKDGCKYQFYLDENMNIIVSERISDLDVQSWLESITDLLDDLKSSDLGQKVIDDLFSILIQNYSHNSFSTTFILLYILENMREEMLLTTSDSIISFLQLNLSSDDPEVLLISLNILEAILDKFDLDTPSKLFLLEITPRILHLTKHESREIRVKAICINEIISQIYTSSSFSTQIATENKLEAFKAISSKHAYERGYGYFKIRNLIISGKWNEEMLNVMISSLDEEEVFVFDQSLPAWKASGVKHMEDTLKYLMQKGREAEESWRIERVNEIIFLIIKEKGILIHNLFNAIIVYVQTLMDKRNEIVVCSSLMLLSQVCKALKSGIHTHLPYILRTAINYVKSYTLKKQTLKQDSGMKASLVILEKIMKCIYTEFLLPYLPDISQTIELLSSSNLIEENRILLQNTRLAYELLSQKLIGEVSRPQVPYLLM
jgi:hypothetical protein